MTPTGVVVTTEEPAKKWHNTVMVPRKSFEFPWQVISSFNDLKLYSIIIIIIIIQHTYTIFN
jgi:hypothetical protein